MKKPARKYYTPPNIWQWKKPPYFFYSPLDWESPKENSKGKRAF